MPRHGPAHQLCANKPACNPEPPRRNRSLIAWDKENPKRVVREDLRNFKRLMEIGEILTIIGQPHGTCTGRGKPYTENQWRPLFT